MLREALVNDALTTIGGEDHQYAATNKLLSLSGRLWEEVLPPMPTEQMHPAAANTPTHLVVARGGQNAATVEVLNTETLQWSTASSLPEEVWCLQMTICGGCLYLADIKSNAFSRVLWKTSSSPPTAVMVAPCGLDWPAFQVGGSSV